MAERLPRCSWCAARRVKRRGQKFCSHTCRQRAYEWRRVLEGRLSLLSLSLASAHKSLDNVTAALVDRHIISPAVPKEEGK